MNIFYLDHDLTRCAQAHCDKHVVKMILESTQILCTVLHQQGLKAPYRSTHQKHPSVIWAATSLDNWCWLRKLTRELNTEFQYRFEHDIPHKSAAVAETLSLPPLPELGLTEHAQVMPEEYKIPGNAVAAYRQFYSTEKRHLLAYTKRKIPEWLG